jgi:hypothetical protein
MSTTVAAPKRVSRDDGFGRSTRFYDVNGRRLPSVTSILSAIGKPALVGWSAKVERKAVSLAAVELYEDLPEQKRDQRMPREAYLALLEKRLGKVRAHTKEMAKAADLGSAVHARIEWGLRKDLGQVVGPEPMLQDKALWAFMAYEDWAKQANLVPLMVEQTVYSERYGYAGTMDWLGEITHEGQRSKVVGDWKTSRGLHPESSLQNAAYAHALVEMGHADPPLAGCVVRLPKVETDPGFEVKFLDAEGQKARFKVFLATLDLWTWLDGQK